MNMNQRSINKLHKKSAHYPGSLVKEDAFVTLSGLLVNRNIIK